jgi:hypothetical protein
MRLDQMTQQNAALVGQSSAAAESLKEQATRLAEVVNTFQLEDAAGVKPTQAKIQPPARASSPSVDIHAKTAAKTVRTVAAGTAMTGPRPGPKPVLIAATGANKVDAWERSERLQGRAAPRGGACGICAMRPSDHGIVSA